MEMNRKNLEKLNFAKEILDKRNAIYRELKNGQLQIDTVNFWATTEKWYDTKSGLKGQGINSLIKYLKDNSFIIRW